MSDKVKRIEKVESPVDDEVDDLPRPSVEQIIAARGGHVNTQAISAERERHVYLYANSLAALMARIDAARKRVAYFGKSSEERAALIARDQAHLAAKAKATP